MWFGGNQNQDKSMENRNETTTHVATIQWQLKGKSKNTTLPNFIT